MALTTGKKLNRAWRDLRESQVQAGLGFMSRGGPGGQSFHQQVFRLGVERPPDWDELSDEVQAAYDAVNVHRQGMLRDSAVSIATSVTPANCLPPKTWRNGKAVMLTRRTQRLLAGAAARSGVGCIEGMQGSGGPGGIKLVRREGLAGSGQVGTRRAIPTRHPGHQAARVLREHRATPVTAGSDLTSRKTANGQVVGQHLPNRPEIRVAMVSDGESTQGVGSSVAAVWSDGPPVSVEFAVAVSAQIVTGLGAQWAVPIRLSGTSLTPMGFGVTLRHETPDSDSYLTYTIDSPVPAGVDADEPTTWPVIVELTAEANEVTPYEIWTVAFVWWS